MSSAVDYLAITFPVRDPVEVMAWLSPFFYGFSETRGAHGYKGCWRAEGVSVFHDGAGNMGTHVQISGVGCAVLSNHAEFSGWGAVLADWIEKRGSPTRVDLAFDDMSGACTMDKMLASIEGGHYTSRWQSRSHRQSVARGERTANVLYMGSASSDTCLCVYDKQLERRGAGVPDTGPWLRAELRFKRDQAAALVSWIIEHPTFEGIEGLLAGCVDFKEESTDVNKSRVKSCAWWKDFLHHASKFKIMAVKAVRSVARRAAEFIRQQGPTLAMLATVLDAGRTSGAYLTEVMNAGMSHLRERHLNFIAQGLMDAGPVPALC